MRIPMWLKPAKPIDPGAEHIAKLNAEAKARAEAPPASLYLRTHRPTVYHQDSRPIGASLGDLWFSQDDGVCRRYDGVDWIRVVTRDEIQTNAITAERITAGTLNTFNHMLY